MKTTINLKKLLIITGLFFSVALLKSNNTPSNATHSNETEKTIQAYFKFPQILIPQLGFKSQPNSVEVLFTTDSFGKVNFVFAKTANQNFKTEIEKQFSKLQLSKIKHGVVHSVVLNFKTL